MIKFNGINHLAMATADMDTTIHFWRDLLGMRLVAGLGRPGFRHYFFEISDTDMLAFFEWPDVEKAVQKDHGAPVKGPFIFDHVSFGVENDDALWDLKDRLESAGFFVSEVVNHGFIHSIYTHDPNNIPIEFSANVPGINVRKNPKMRDKKPTDAALEGAEPQAGYWPEEIRRTPLEERGIYPGEGMIIAEEESDQQKTEQNKNKRPHSV